MNIFEDRKLVAKLSKVASYILIVWIVFLLGRSLWQNWSLKQSIQKLNDQIATLEKDKKNLNNLLVYYKSDSFKELEARKKLGLKKTDEKMVILPVSSGSPLPSSANFSEEVKKEQQSITSSEAQSPTSNWQLWWKYLIR